MTPEGSSRGVSLLTRPAWVRAGVRGWGFAVGRGDRLGDRCGFWSGTV